MKAVDYGLGREAAGALPPVSARNNEPHYVTYYTLRDEPAGTDWIGLNKVTNADKGVLGPIDLVPGEYKLELSLPKRINANLFHDGFGSIAGGVQSLLISEADKAQAAKERGLPSSFLSVKVVVQAKKYAIAELKGEMDLGLSNTFTRTFIVPPRDSLVHMTIEMKSQTVLKRLKVTGVLYRRDFASPEPNVKVERKKAAATGKEILHRALSAEQPRLDPDVNLQKIVYKFYEDNNPERLKYLDKVFSHFKGRDNDLIHTLEAKYNVKFNNRGEYRRE